MNSAEFEALFCDVPRLTAEEVAAFLGRVDGCWSCCRIARGRGYRDTRGGICGALAGVGAHKLAPRAQRAHRAEARDLGGDDGATEAAQEGAMSLKRGDRTFLHLLRRSL